MQEASLQLSATEQKKWMTTTVLREHTFQIQSPAPTSGQEEVCTFYTSKSHSSGSNPCSMQQQLTDCVSDSEHHKKKKEEKQLSSRNPLSETHCQRQKEVKSEPPGDLVTARIPEVPRPSVRTERAAISHPPSVGWPPGIGTRSW